MLRNALSAFAICAALPASADLSDVARLEVIPGWTMPSGHQMAGLNIALAEGWKTYWRAPGDGGIPPVITFSGSTNIRTAQFHWPVPEIFDQNGMRSVGYDGGLVLPIEIAPIEEGPIHLAGELQIGVCEEICIPVTLTFDVDLPVNQSRDPQLLAAVLDRPLSQSEAGVTQSICSVSPISDGLEITATVTLPSTGGTEAMVIEAGDASIWVSEPYTERAGDQITGVAEMVSGTGQPFVLDRSAVRITIIGQNTAVDVIGCSAG